MATLGRVAVAGALCALALAPLPALASDGSELCVTCHVRAPQSDMPTHPIDVPVLGRVSGDAAGLPLDAGRVTCLTCHAGHGPAGREAADADFFLRVTVPELCARCHRAASGAWDTPHAQYPDTVHGGPRLAGPAPAGLDGTEPEVDDFSKRCLACHGGAELVPDFPGMPPQIEVGHSHPLIDYGSARPTRGGVYRAAAEIGPSARLVEGRVSCASCHRVYGSHRALTTTESRRALCLGCHDIGHPRWDVQQALGRPAPQPASAMSVAGAAVATR